jgi:hypothetical protein
MLMHFMDSIMVAAAAAAKNGIMLKIKSIVMTKFELPLEVKWQCLTWKMWGNHFHVKPEWKLWRQW